ncbi:MAG: hypothetical protein NTZ49_06120 [Candidatus Parcubacteria bacterium]|nr:hypothetical protein [Candidatus Parcubacteria bacterium]
MQPINTSSPSFSGICPSCKKPVSKSYSSKTSEPTSTQNKSGFFNRLFGKIFRINQAFQCKPAGKAAIETDNFDNSFIESQILKLDSLFNDIIKCGRTDVERRNNLISAVSDLLTDQLSGRSKIERDRISNYFLNLVKIYPSIAVDVGMKMAMGTALKNPSAEYKERAYERVLDEIRNSQHVDEFADYLDFSLREITDDEKRNNLISELTDRLIHQHSLEGGDLGQQKIMKHLFNLANKYPSIVKDRAIMLAREQLIKYKDPYDADLLKSVGDKEGMQIAIESGVLLPDETIEKAARDILEKMRGLDGLSFTKHDEYINNINSDCQKLAKLQRPNILFFILIRYRFQAHVLGKEKMVSRIILDGFQEIGNSRLEVIKNVMKVKMKLGAYHNLLDETLKSLQR